MKVKVFFGVFLLMCMIVSQNMWAYNNVYSNMTLTYNQEAEMVCCDNQMAKPQEKDPEECCDAFSELTNAQDEHSGCEDSPCHDSSSCCVTFVYTSFGAVFKVERSVTIQNAKQEPNFGFKSFNSLYNQSIWIPPKITFLG